MFKATVVNTPSVHKFLLKPASKYLASTKLFTTMQEVVKTLEEKRKARATEWYLQKKKIMVSVCTSTACSRGMWCFTLIFISSPLFLSG